MAKLSLHPAFTALLLLVPSGCQSIEGQVAKTSYWPLPKNTPAALPVKAGSDQEPAFVPILGDFIDSGLNAQTKTRKLLYYDDPSEYKVLSYTRSPLAGVEHCEGVSSHNGPTLENRVGVSIGASEIPIEGGTARLTLDAKRDFTLKNLRLITLAPESPDYFTALASSWADQEQQAYFVSAVVAADASEELSDGLDLSFAPPDGSNLPEADLRASFEKNYSGVGLIVGVELQKLISAGKRDPFSSPGTAQEMGFAAAAEDSGLATRDRPYIYNQATNEAGEQVAELIVTATITNSANGRIRSSGVRSDREWSQSNTISLKPGEHFVEFFDTFGTAFTATRMYLLVVENENGLLKVSNIGDAEQYAMSWKGYGKHSH